MKKSFDEVFADKTKYCTKIKTSDYFEQGEYAIIDQGQNQIAGYTSLQDGVFNDVPAIVFGDHTRIIKYIDEPFFIGADGVKVLRSKLSKSNYKYLYYALKNADIPNTGYNRHFKWLKEVKINYPSSEKQNEIVKILDEIVSIIDCRKQQLQQLDELVKARFVELFYSSNEVVRLDSLIKPYRADKCRQNTYPVLSITMHNGLVLQSERFKKEIASGDKSQYKVVPRNKLVVAFPIDEGLLSAQTIVDVGIVSPAYSLYDIDENKIYPEVLECILRSDLSIQYYKSKMRGTTLRRRMIPKSDFDSMPINLPSIERQKQYLNEIKEIDKSKFVVQKALDEAQTLIDSLMQEYFG